MALFRLLSLGIGRVRMVDEECGLCAEASERLRAVIRNYQSGALLVAEVANKIVWTWNDSMNDHGRQLRAEGREAPRELVDDYGDQLAEAWSWHVEAWLRSLLSTLDDPEVTDHVWRGLGRSSERATKYAADVATFERLCERASQCDADALVAATSIVGGNEHAWRAHSLVDHGLHSVALAAFPVDWPTDRWWHPCGWPNHLTRHYWAFVRPLLRWLADAARDGADGPYDHLLALLADEERGLHTFVVELLPIRDPDFELEVLLRRMDRGMLGQGELTERLDAAIERLGGTVPDRGSVHSE